MGPIHIPAAASSSYDVTEIARPVDFNGIHYVNSHNGSNGASYSSAQYEDFRPGSMPKHRPAHGRPHGSKKVNPEYQFDYARRANAVLSVCVILLISLVCCLISFLVLR